MGEFDHHIKSKIDSLDGVPGVNFDESKVWRKIKFKMDTNLKGGVFLSGLLLIGVLGWIYTSYSIIEEQDVIENEVISKPKFNTKTDSIATKVRRVLSILKTDKQDDILAKGDPEDERIDKSRKYINEKITTPVSKLSSYSTVAYDRSTAEIIDQKVENSQEVSLSVERGAQMTSFINVKGITPRLSIASAVQFKRNFDKGFGKGVDSFRRPTIDQVKVSLGVRYDLVNQKKRFIPFFYAGFTNAFGLRDSGVSTYHLNFESNIELRIRLFSTRDGSKGFLHFRLPLFNKNVINRGLYKPDLFSILRK